MSRRDRKLIRVATVVDLEKEQCMTVHAAGLPIVLFAHDGAYYALDNRCPHMGFPLDQGTVQDRILTCHWHHARFDIESGGTFDQWADDVRKFPVEIEEGEIWIDVGQFEDPFEHQRRRLLVGLERNIPLVIGKAVLVFSEREGGLREAYCDGLQFGTAFRQDGWGQGLTILTCLMNISPLLHSDHRALALYHGLAAVAAETIGSAPRFGIWPLPDEGVPMPTLRRWFRQFVEVRDAQGAERCLITAVASGADDMQMADMLFAAATDHRYIGGGHVLDFTNKALEALDSAGWQYAGPVLSSLARLFATAERMEEANAWRNPQDLVALLEDAFLRLPKSLAENQAGRQMGGAPWNGRQELVEVLLADSPEATIEALLAALADGATEAELAAAVSYAAALRIARLHTSNEFADWDTALHTLTFANAVEQGLRRAPSAELLRAVFDGAMSVYLDRFLNIPAANLPQPSAAPVDTGELLAKLSSLLDSQQRVNEAGEAAAAYFLAGGSLSPLMAAIGGLLLREDRDFHTIQAVEALFQQAQYLSDETEIMHVIVAAARYLAAHSPTVRAQGQTYQIARRLHKGEELFV